MLDRAGAVHLGDSDSGPRAASGTYRPDIDGLRAVAVLLVVVYHAWPARLPRGYLGVDVFFVISGFLITSIIVKDLRAGQFSFARFYSRRARRILPALLLVLLAALVLGWYALLAGELEGLGRHVLGAMFFIANFQLMAETGYFDPAAETKPLLHLWSLGVEEQFYLTFPLVLWAAWRSRLSLVAVAAGLGITSLLLHFWLASADPTAAFYLPVTRTWELMAGALLAAAAPLSGAGAGLSSGTFTSAVGGVLVAAGVVVGFSAVAGPVAPLLLTVAGSALLIHAGRQAFVNRRVLMLAPLVAIGLISYPLYLWHWLLLSFSRVYLGQEGASAVAPALVLISFMLAWLTYRLAERPIRTGLVRGRVTAGVLASLAALVIVAGTIVVGQEGLPDRQAPRQQALAEFARSPHEPFRDRACEEVVGGFDGLDLDGCLSSAAAPPSVVLLGDSHAHQYFNSLAARLSGTPVLHLGRWSCLPFSSKSHQSEPCQRSIVRSREYVLAQPSVSTVVLAGYWAYLMAGGFGRNEGGYREAAPFDSAEAEVFVKSGHEQIGALLAAGKRVVLILDTPNLNFNIQLCMFDPAAVLAGTRVPPGCALDRRQFEARNARYDETMARLVADHPGLRVFNPRTVLCEEVVCHATRGGRSLYYDSDHLSRLGTDLVIARMAEAGLLGHDVRQE